MRALSIALVAIALVFGAASVGADSGACPMGCPSTGPLPVGEGPLVQIFSIGGQPYDWIYMSAMYQQNSDIMNLANQGYQRAHDGLMRAFSRKIYLERVDMNQDLNDWYRIFTNRAMPTAPDDRYAALWRGLSVCSGENFDCMYAGMMMGLMQQSEDAADDAVNNSSILELRLQARVVSSTNYNEIQALLVWQQTGILRFGRK